MYVMGENPVLADPDCGRVAEALSHLDFLVVQDIFLSETAALADVVLPVAGFGERDGTQTSAERRVQRVRKAQEPVGGAKPDWQVICDIAARLGFAEQFTYADTAAIFREIAAVTAQYARHGLRKARPARGPAVALPLARSFRAPRSCTGAVQYAGWERDFHSCPVYPAPGSTRCGVPVLPQQREGDLALALGLDDAPVPDA